MSESSRITSKRQVTIPIKIFNEFELEQGDQLIFQVRNNKIVIQKARDILQELAGSVKVPQEYKGLTTEETIKKAKEEYFKKRK